jgi:hypothetical protein
MADVEAEFKKRDKTANGYLSGTEIPADYRQANPGKDRVTLQEFQAFRKKQEDAANAADKAEFARRDVNGDHQLDGNEVGGDAKYDRGGNWTRPDGTSATEVTDMEFLAGRAEERRKARWADIGGAPAAPAGGGNPAGGGAPAGGGTNPTGGTGPVGTQLPGVDETKRKAPPKATLRDKINTNKDLKAFNRADRNNDGVLTGTNTLKKYAGFDGNNDGKITAEEFLAGRAKKRAENEFKRADRNGDGTLTGTNTLKKYGAYDANGDGKVTKEEYVQGRLGQTEKPRASAANYAAMDKNHDGNVSWFERATFVRRPKVDDDANKPK